MEGSEQLQYEGGGVWGERGGGGRRLTCPTQGATLQPSRPEDTVQVRTLCNWVLQKSLQASEVCEFLGDKGEVQDREAGQPARQQW